MHPEIDQPEPGTCPICSMDLVPRKTVGSGKTQAIRFSDRALRLMQVQTAAVERRTVTAEVHLSGTVGYDETRTATISAWVPGRLDRLFVDFTGMSVRKGDHMVEIYSPKLLETQQELIQAFQSVAELGENDSALVRNSAIATAKAAREKARLLGLTDEQISQIIERGQPADTLTIYAPMGGVVIEKHRKEGTYVQTGTPIYSVANLAQVWIELDAFESDLTWLRLGQTVSFTTAAYPGDTFRGTVNFIAPTLNKASRTVQVRVTAPNDQGRLKPGMVVSATVRAEVAAGGKVVVDQLADKWMCPMHPDVVKEGPGDCTICGMPLETTESLGYVSLPREQAPKPLVIPNLAVLRTGRRSIVYVEKNAPEGELEYVLRQVTLGPRAGDHFIVRQGLREGERVVVRGNFKIDSERQLRGMSSMMNPPAGQAGPQPADTDDSLLLDIGDQPAAFRRALADVWSAYFDLSDALAGDDPNSARNAAEVAVTSLAKVPSDDLPASAKTVWQRNAADLAKLLEPLDEAGSLQALRDGFHPLSQEMLVIARHFGHPEGRDVHLMLCPMAFENRGATWLQLSTDVANPYFGESMFRCGEVKESLTFSKPEEGHNHDAMEGAHE